MQGRSAAWASPWEAPGRCSTAAWPVFSAELYGRYIGREWVGYAARTDYARRVSLYFDGGKRLKEMPDYENDWDRSLTKDMSPLKDAGVEEETMKGAYSVLLLAIMLADQSPRTLTKLEEAARIPCDYARVCYRTARVLQSLGSLEWLT